MTIFYRSLPLLVLFLNSPSYANDSKEPGQKPNQDNTLLLSSYEPNYLSYVWEEGDENYMDAKLSLKYPLMHFNEYSKDGSDDNYFNLYFALNLRFSQYINTRHSSPVVGKQYQPRIFSRTYFESKYRYVDLAYVHESNGQSIDRESQYIDARNLANEVDGHPDDARDYISRGWDYAEARIKFSLDQSNDDNAIYLYVKHFIDSGIFQEEPEEIRSFEGVNGPTDREDVDGITLSYKRYNNDHKTSFFVQYSTGIDNTFQYGSGRLEYTFPADLILPNWFEFPLTIWATKGHQTDLVGYNESITQFGIGIQFVTEDHFH